MAVVLLLAVIWAAVLVPPAIRSQRARRKAFEISFGQGPASPIVAPVAAATGRRSPAVQRRRRIAGGLLTAVVATGLVGLLPTFRVLLVVHLFVVDSFLFYVASLARRADRQTREGGDAPTRDAGFAPSPRRRRPVRRSVVLADLPPVASAR
jgi:energy-converting hydrogenase Eha subunit A